MRKVFCALPLLTLHIHKINDLAFFSYVADQPETVYLIIFQVQKHFVVDFFLFTQCPQESFIFFPLPLSILNSSTYSSCQSINQSILENIQKYWFFDFFSLRNQNCLPFPIEVISHIISWRRRKVFLLSSLFSAPANENDKLRLLSLCQCHLHIPILTTSGFSPHCPRLINSNTQVFVCVCVCEWHN